jgi:MoxR-like ATPase
MTLSPEKFLEHATKIESEVGRVIVGQREVVRSTLVSILAGGHVLLEGVPGLGKTMLIKTLGQALDLKFSRIQFTPDMMPADILGTEILSDEDGKREFRFRRGPLFANLILADEINRATPKTQSALLEAMQEGSVSIAQQTHKLEEPFFVMATQNPLEMEGTYPLPEAQLDRFFFKVNVELPNVGDMVEILDRTTGKESPSANNAVTGADIIEMRALARTTPIASHVKEYIARLVLATHPTDANASPLVKKYVRYGVSPRGGQALVLGAKVTALMAGRYNVAFEDVHAVAKAALRHRLLLNFDGLAEGVKADEVTGELVGALNVQTL